jgi:hypothetical protein
MGDTMDAIYGNVTRTDQSGSRPSFSEAISLGAFVGMSA